MIDVFFLTYQVHPASEDDRSDLQQLGQRASNAFSKAAGSVKEAFEVIDDNVLEYCSLDAKVLGLSEIFLAIFCWSLLVCHLLCWHAGW